MIRPIEGHVRAQSRSPIQVLEEARDAIQTLHVGATSIVTGSVDGYVRTYDLRKGELRSDFIGRKFTPPLLLVFNSSHWNTDPVTSLLPTQDGQTLLVASLDSHIRLMDMSTGKMLNDFTGHKNDSYRCRACFGHAEASIVCGDEKGMIWAWDLLDVSSNMPQILRSVLTWIRRNSLIPILHQKSIQN